MLSSVVACAGPEKADVTFVYGKDIADKTVSVEVGGKLTAPDEPSVDGYEISGWYTDKALTDASKWDFGKNTVDADLTLYASWTEKSGDDTSDDTSGDISTDVIDASSEDPDESGDTSSDTSSGEASDDTSTPVGPKPPAPPSKDEIITVKKAIDIANSLQDGEVTEKRYFIRANVVKISNPNYGEMYISDGTGEIYVYGSYSSDGKIGYASMSKKPYKGDEVYISAVIQNYKGNPELKSVWIHDFKTSEIQVNEKEYTPMTVSEARNAAKETKIKTSGVVARITYANGKVPNGFILIDNTSSIYVFDSQIASRVSIGNTVTLLGEKTWWILENELDSANKFGYAGSCQLENVVLLSNDGKTSDFNSSWITETTVKDILNTPYSTDITSKVFKVNALVKKAAGDGFVNYYFNDIDGVTGSYTYTQCSGADFDWLDKFDGKICTVYLTALNAKSTATGCVWRFLPVKVVDESFKFNPDNAAKFAVDYYAIDQFIAEYAADPVKQLVTNVDSELWGISGVKISYASSNESVAYVKSGVFHTGKAGTATITISATYGSYSPYSTTVQVKVTSGSSVSAITVKEAIDSPLSGENETITVSGIVGPSLVNQKGGFYLIDETGAIAVKFGSESDISLVSIGDKVVITGRRDAYGAKNGYPGQICITSATLETNLYGQNEYSTSSFNKSKAFADVYGMIQDVFTERTATVFVIEGMITFTQTKYSANYYVTNPNNADEKISLYSSSGNQYKWLEGFVGKTVKMEIALCNWNAKTPYKACILAVYNEDGTKVLNTLNFD